MRVRLVKLGTSAIIFIFLTLAVFFLVRPVYLSVTAKLVELRDSLFTALEEKTALKINYQKASPSILTGLKLQNVQVVDSQSNLILLKINSVGFTYNLPALLSGNIEKGLDDLVIQGISAEYDAKQNKEVINRISTLISTLSNSEKKSSLSFNIPFGIKIINTTLSYFDDNFRVKTRLKNIRLKSGEDSNLIMAEIKGDLNFYPKAQQFLSLGNIETDFSILGTISSALDEFAAQLRVFSLSNGNISAKPLQFVCDFSDDVFNAQILQNTAPVHLTAQYNIKNKNASVNLQAQDFEPFALIRIKNKKDSLNKFIGTKIFGKYQLAYQGQDNSLIYSGIGGISTGKNLGLDTINANFSFLGNQDFVDVDYLNLRSSFISADFEGNCNLKTLQPEGSFFLNYFKLNNGNELTLEMYLDHLDKGFMCFIPQINFGQNFFTALQLDIIPQQNSIDYEMSVFDYSNQLEGIIGNIGANGSVLLDSSPYIQCNLSLDSLFISSVLKAVSFFLDEKSSESISGMANTFSPYVMSSEFFVSTDLSSITFNVPYSVIANTKKDGEMALLSFDGTESALQISQLDVLFAGQEINITLDADYGAGFENLFFTSDIALNSVPYTLSGTVIDAKRISLTGDYGFNAEIFKSSKDISGSLAMDGLPLSAKNLLLALSLDSEFKFNSLSDWNVKINRFEFIDNNTKNNIPPRLTFMGNLNNYGALFDRINFTDSTSILSGQGSMLWNFNQDTLMNASINMNLEDSVSSEKILVECSASNPMNKTFSQMDFLKDIFLSAEISIKNSPLSRFLAEQKSPNVLNANITALGPINNPGVTLSVYDTSILLGGSPLNLKIDASLEDGNAKIIDSSVDFAGQKISGLQAQFSLSSFSGDILGTLEGNLLGGSYNSPFEINITSPTDLISDEFEFSSFKIPESFLISVVLNKITSQTFGDYENIKLSAVSSPGRIDFFGGNNSIVGSFVDKKLLKIETSQDLPIRMSVNGIIENSLLDIAIDNFYLDFSKVTNFLNFPFFKALSGYAYGNLHIGGYSTDPEFSGDLIAQDFLYSIPSYVKENLYSKQIKIDVEDNAFVMNNFASRTKKGYVDASIRFEFDRWALYSVLVDVKTRGSTLVPGQFIMPNMQYEGDVACDLNIDVILAEGVTIKGSIFAQDVDGTFSLFSSGDEEVSSDDASFFYTKVDLDMLVGQHGQVFFPNKENPVLKALINPQTKIRLKLDSETDYFELSGDLVFRGGSIVALGRTFYLREGRLVFNENQGSFDPTITVRAEMRETDSEGDTVRIYLSADNQKLSAFSPSFSSSPPKSESEIMSILGQIVLSDDTTSIRDVGINVLASGLNYVAQTTAVKELEDRLRDLLKFDIFSLRTSILQNALLVGLNNENNNVTIGNYLDNSSVYIGKYFGNAMYLDGLLHFDYNASLVESGRSLTGLSFEPEFGFELDSPFALIRWSLSPNINNLNNFWIPDVSVGLSWKFLF